MLCVWVLALASVVLCASIVQEVPAFAWTPNAEFAAQAALEGLPLILRNSQVASWPIFSSGVFGFDDATFFSYLNNLREENTRISCRSSADPVFVLKDTAQRGRYMVIPDHGAAEARAVVETRVVGIKEFLSKEADNLYHSSPVAEWGKFGTEVSELSLPGAAFDGS